MESVPSPMHVLCPSCATGYEIETISRPRRLRCAKCGAEWRELPPETVAAPDLGGTEAAVPDAALPEPLLPEPALPELESSDPLRADRDGREALSVRPTRRAPALAIVLHMPRREDALLLGLWILSLAVMALALFAFWHWRAAIGHRWPPSLRLYRLLSRPTQG